MHVSPDFVALCVVGVIILGNYLGLLDRLGIRNKSATDAAAELAIREATIERLVGERDKARAEKAELAATRSLEPVLAQLQAHADLQKQVLDRLVHHNGSFAHMETSMRELVESIRLLTGFVAGVLELPQKEKKP